MTRHNVLTGGFGAPIERPRNSAEYLTAWSWRKPPKPPRVGVQRAVYVTKDTADARDAAEQARWNMRVTLSLRNNYERRERHAVPVPAKLN